MRLWALKQGLENERKDAFHGSTGLSPRNGAGGFMHPKMPFFLTGLPFHASLRAAQSPWDHSRAPRSSLQAPSRARRVLRPQDREKERQRTRCVRATHSFHASTPPTQ